ncbi:hypothetical protein BpHYR1_040872 [Brachionus plicatilis]|uniref:Uncharacterized protein n=1 Tax=Brachionus plicatilis TaxID=10195 RepID=A0A3M7P7V4_BRAPC|nr:hypothetical protein BpHYR1_040872 [Brachionus plicatilis]
MHLLVKIQDNNFKKHYTKNIRKFKNTGLTRKITTISCFHLSLKLYLIILSIKIDHKLQNAFGLASIKAKKFKLLCYGCRIFYPK